jgi:microcystin-dependent protein
VSSPFIGEIRMFGGNFAPAGWVFCNGQLMPIAENDALFTLIGTTYGGDGQETFGIPNLQSRVPIHAGTGSDGVTYQLGEMAGSESVTLTTQQIPNHTHPWLASLNPATQSNPAGQVTASNSPINIYRTLVPPPPMVNMAANMIAPVGGSQPHANLQPYLAISYIMSLFGIFPSQN